MNKVIIFAPFGSWMVHHQLDCVIGKALVLRGADVRVLGCDGIMDRCRIQGREVNPSACENCQRNASEWFGRFGLPVTGLSKLLSGEERQEIASWAEGLDISSYNQQCFRGWAVGKWMDWMLHSALLTGRVDYADPAVQQRARDFAAHGAMIAIAATRMLQDFKPSHAICYNGTNSYYRVFFEMCKEAGVPVLLHERGAAGNTFSLLDNMRNKDVLAKTFPEWEHAPLSHAQWERVASFYKDRALGQNSNFFSIHTFTSEAGNARDRLRIPRDARVLMLLLSGDWEYGMAAYCEDRAVMISGQIALAKLTASIAKSKGWHLIIRHHPLGAGKNSYPRATAFLTDLLRERASFGEHVRVVLPGEKLSTYDCFPVVDAVAGLFSTSASEAVTCGIPVVSACDSTFNGMGMVACYQVADYEAALVKAMSTPPCTDEEVMRRAFRYAHCFYYVVNSWAFSSVGIQNTYGTDFRLASPDDLVPGVDATLDHVCEHILQGVPLYPAPTVPPASEAEEIQFVRERLEGCLATRTALAALPPPIAQRSEALILRLGEPKDRANAVAVAPEDWVSRHKEVRFEWLRLDMIGAFDAVRHTLIQRCAGADSAYVMLLPEHSTLDESVLSRGIDLLELDENAGKQGVFFGCYTLAPSGELGPEWNTLIRPAQSTARPPCLEEPLTLMGLVLWRQAAFVEWLSSSSCPAPDADDTLCDALSSTFQDAGRFIQISEPQVFVRQLETVEDLHDRAQAAADEGNLDKAFEIALQARRRFGFTRGLRCRMARWLMKADRHAQAVPLLYASLKTGSSHRENMDLLSSSLPHVLAGKGEFKHLWTAVNKVFGYMVAGQEEYLHNKVKSLPRDARIVEIGSFYGRSTVAMGYACAGTSRRLVCIDSFCGNDGQMGPNIGFYHLWRGNLRQWGLESYAEGRPGYSHPRLRAMPADEMYDFAFIDASHEYADVLLDFELVYPHVKPGGWIAFHDVEPGWPGSWRVWEQTGKRVLVDHETCSTIACGRKVADVEWRSYEADWPGFRVAYANHLLAAPELAGVAQALLAIADTTPTDAMRKELEARITNAPEQVRNELRWGVTKEKDNDPWVHYCAGLAQQSHSPENAEQHFAEARRLGLPL